MFFVSSSWLLKLEIVSAIYLPVFFFLDFARAREFSLISQKRELFGTGYALVWYILRQLFTSVSVKSGKYLPRPAPRWIIV